MMSTLTKLATQWIHANNMYRAGTPVMSDGSFDKLERKIRAIAPDHSCFNVRGDDFGSELQNDAPLTIFMGSQDKALNLTELAKFFASTPSVSGYHSSYKMDGLSCELSYVAGEMQLAVSRGDDGLTGKDLTEIVCFAQDIPESLPHSFTGPVRGEVYLTKANLALANEWLVSVGRKPMANVRNGAVAITRTLRNLPMAKFLSFRAFDLLPSNVSYATLSAKYTALANLGFVTPVWTVSQDFSACKQFIAETDAMRDDLEYDIDGVVISIDNIDDMQALGSHQGCMVGQIAFKFEARASFVEILDIEWSFEGTESATPVAIYAPTHLGGADCTRASMKSWRWMKENNVGIGSIVRVKRSGDVIPCLDDETPQWLQFTPATHEHKAPTACPHCASAVVEDGAVLICVNNACHGKEAARVNKFFKAVGVKGLAWQSLCDYTREGVTLADFFQENFKSIVYNKIRASANVSLIVWNKIAAQIAGRE